ncbi:MAG: 3-phosphoshikimate 1-carboxyvinyltransferase [Halanaerobiaceae bacterium]
MKLKINKKNTLSGEIKVPGDKSISHRSIIINSIASNKTKISGFLESQDCLHTLNAFRNMGVKIIKINPGEYKVTGVGLNGLQEPSQILDCGNSGTCMRIMTGLMSGQNFYSVLTGDSSLRERPMARIINPLTRMGAKIWSRRNNLAPLSIKGTDLINMKYKLPVASAQVKSSLLLAGLYGKGILNITEPGPSRDHTERMLESCGIPLKKDGFNIVLSGNKVTDFSAEDIVIPGDISSASYFIAAGLITENSKIKIKETGINPTRNGILEVLEKMKANINIENKKIINGEPMADILIKSSDLKATVIEGKIIPRLIDEIPIIAVIATQAEGETVIKDAEELRVKETDRINALVSELSKMGAEIEELKDGMIIKGPVSLKGSMELNSFGDHRIAMSLAIAGLISKNKVRIKNCDCINTSFPDFTDILHSLYN